MVGESEKVVGWRVEDQARREERVPKVDGVKPDILDTEVPFEIALVRGALLGVGGEKLESIDFDPGSAKLLSFYVSYRCTKCSEETERLLAFEKEDAKELRKLNSYVDTVGNTDQVRNELQALEGELRMLARAEQEHDLQSCVPVWRITMEKAEAKSDRVLDKLIASCFDKS